MKRLLKIAGKTRVAHMETQYTIRQSVIFPMYPHKNVEKACDFCPTSSHPFNKLSDTRTAVRNIGTTCLILFTPDRCAGIIDVARP